MFNFKDQLAALVKSAQDMGEHGAVIAHALMGHAHDVLTAEVTVIERHNHRLFGDDA